jgi:hypothetical protein
MAVKGPKGIIIAQVEIAIPGYPAFSGTVDYIEGEQVPRLDDVAIQLHGIVNDIVMSIRNNEPTIDGEKKGK